MLASLLPLTWAKLTNLIEGQGAIQEMDSQKVPNSPQQVATEDGCNEDGTMLSIQFYFEIYLKCGIKHAPLFVPPPASFKEIVKYSASFHVLGATTFGGSL